MIARPQKRESLDEITPGVSRTLLCHGERMMMVEVKLDRGTRLAECCHSQEQIYYLVRGTAFLRVGELGIALKAEESVRIPANTPYAGEALTDCTLIAVYSPARPDAIKSTQA